MFRAGQIDKAHSELSQCQHMERLNYAAQGPMPPFTELELYHYNLDSVRLNVMSLGIFPSTDWDEVARNWETCLRKHIGH